MYLPPGMLESLDHKYRPEPFDSTVKTTETIASPVLGSREESTWPVKEFSVKPESWLEIGGGFIMLLLGLWIVAAALLSGNAVETQRGLFLLVLLLWMPIASVRHLIRRVSLGGLGNVTLDAHRLIWERGGGAEPKSIRYERICTVKSAAMRTWQRSPALTRPGSQSVARRASR